MAFYESAAPFVESIVGCRAVIVEPATSTQALGVT
jgi:hypothetical protein